MKTDKKEAEQIYDNLSEFYHNKRLRGNDWNAIIEQPTTFSLLGKVKGKKVLDAGCGSGIYSKILAKKGAKVFGLELSGEMLKLAKQHCSKENINFKQGSIDKLPYKKNSFDIVVASLVIHYLAKPERAFKEFNRVLKKDGILVFSTNHPIGNGGKTIEIINGKKIVLVSDYFKESKYYWTLHGKEEVKIPCYSIGFEKLFNMIYQNGFILEKFKEPYLTLKKAKRDSDKKYADTPTFIVLRCRKLK